jgi:hypothetical protein
MQSAAKTPRGIHKHTPFIVAVVLAAIVPAIAQVGAGSGEELQRKIAILRESVAENQQKLHGYQWTETTQLTLNGNVKPPTQQMCQYGPDGTVQKFPMGPSPEPPSGGRLKQRVIEKKKEEMKDYMGEVKNLLSMYVPPDPQRIAQAFQAGNASLNPIPAAQQTAIVFRNYAQPGDELTIVFDTTARKIRSVSVNTYMDDPKEKVRLTVNMASLPDGTNYAQQTHLDATAKKLQVTTTNAYYRMMGAQ